MTDWNAAPPAPHERVALQDDKTWGAIAYGIPLAGYVFTGGIASFIGSIVVYVLAKDKSPITRQYARGALNLQLNALLWTVVSLVLMLVLIGFVTIFLVAIWALVLNIIGLIKGLNGEAWEPPMCIKFVS